MKLARFFHIVILVSILLLFFSLTGYAFAAQGQSAEALFQQANNLYGNGNYSQALQIYGKIITEDGVSGPLLYNLGNCYARLGQTGMAILNYERALRLAPGDSDIRGNLDLLRKNQGLFREELPLEQRIISFFDLDQWTMMAGLFLVVFTLICLASLRFSNGKQLRHLLGAVSMILFLATATGAVFQYRQLNQAVVISDDAKLLLSPFTKAASIGTIREGRIVEFLSTHGKYSFVEDQAGRSGWIESRDIELISSDNAPQK